MLGKNQLISNSVLIIEQYLRKHIQLDKLYKIKNTFGKIEDKFAFQPGIFNDKYQHIALLSKTYIESVFVILTGQAQTHFLLIKTLLYHLRILIKNRIVF